MREFKTPKGTTLPLMDIKGKPYLSVQHRIMWFREEHPGWSIETICIMGNENETKFQAVIRDDSSRILAMGHKREDAKGFQDHYEKAESGSIGRALGFLGYGTAFALDLEEGQRLADAPTNEVEKKSTSSLGQAVTQKTQATQQDISNDDIQDPGDYVVTFGKHKDKTIREIVDNEGVYKISSYVGWLESDAKAKKKPMGESALDFMEAFNAFVGNRELDQAVPKDKNFSEQIDRLKNSFPGVPGPKMPTAYKDDPEPWPDSNDQIPF